MKPGLYTLTADAYHADPGDEPSLSCSVARILVDQSPAHAWTAHPRLNPDFQTDRDPKYDIGTAAHKMLLEGEDIVQVVDFPDFRTNAAKEARDLAYQHGRIPLLPVQWWETKEMVSIVNMRLLELDLAPSPFTDGEPEQTMVWQEDGVWCRARMDWLRTDLAFCDDLKTTTRSAQGAKWSRGPLFDHGCDFQAAFYRRGLKVLTGVDVPWRWVVVETRPPFAVQVIVPGADVLALGEAKVEKALALWRQCMETNEWPAYPRGVYEAELPPWIESQWLARELQEEAA